MDEKPVQFGLRTLLLGMTACAIVFAIARVASPAIIILVIAIVWLLFGWRYLRIAGIEVSPNPAMRALLFYLRLTAAVVGVLAVLGLSFMVSFWLGF